MKEYKITITVEPKEDDIKPSITRELYKRSEIGLDNLSEIVGEMIDTLENSQKL